MKFLFLRQVSGSDNVERLQTSCVTVGYIKKSVTGVSRVPLDKLVSLMSPVSHIIKSHAVLTWGFHMSIHGAEVPVTRCHGVNVSVKLGYVTNYRPNLVDSINNR